MNGRPFIVPVFIPHAGCPHRCVFCNQWIVTGQAERLAEPQDDLESAIEYLHFRDRRQGPTQIAFFGGNFLGLPHARISRLLASAAQWVHNGDFDGIRFSTRPDTVNPQVLDLIDAFPVRCVELGAQSMNDEVLRQTRRGHTAADTVAAVQRLKERGYETGLQLMVGLPGDDEAGLLESGRRIAELGPAFARIYPTLVLSGSLLERWFHEGRYRPLSLDQAVDLSMKLYRFLRRHGIPVIRTGLQPTQDLAAGRGVVAGPYHPAFGELVQSACYLRAVRRALVRRPYMKDKIELRVHPKNISRARGQRNANCAALGQEFGFSAVRVIPDADLGEEMVALPEGRILNVYATTRG